MARAHAWQMFSASVCLCFLLTAPAAASGVAVSYSQLPLSFQPDRVPGLYTSSGNGYRLSVLPGELRLDLPGASRPLRLRMIGAAPDAEPAALEPLPGHISYLRGRDRSTWRANVTSYGRIRYRNLYPGIDLVFYGNHNELEYDFTVAPGADVRQVKLDVSGARAPRLDASGNVELETEDGLVVLRKPLLYQVVGGRRREVGGRFQVAGSQISIMAGPYVRTLPLVVDPIMTYATFVGRGADDQVKAVALGPDGSTYAAGVARAMSPADQDEAFVAHLSADGKTLLYLTYLGGTGASEARGIAVDHDGNAFVTGATSAADFPVLNAIDPFCDLSPSAKCTGDAFVVRLDPDGLPHFATFLGGTGVDAGNAIAVDSVGDVYLAGTTASRDFPTAGAAQPSTAGKEDGFVVKIAHDGSRTLYSTFLGGTAADQALGIAVDTNFNAYVTGRTESFDFPVFHPMQERCAANGAGDCAGAAFVTKLSVDGASWVYSTYLGGRGGDQANAIAVDRLGQAHIAGTTSSDDFPTLTPLQAKRSGKTEAFVAGLLPDGSGLLYSTYLGGSGDDVATAIALDANGSVFVGGHTDSADFPLKSALQAQCEKDTKKGVCTRDAFVAVLRAGAQLSFSTYLGGTGVDQGTGIAVDPNGLIHLGGASTSADFPSAQPAALAEGRASAETRIARRGGRLQLPARTSRAGALVAVIAHAATLTCPTSGVWKTWTGAGTDTNWSTAKNWSNNTVPATNANVCIAASPNITFDVSSLTLNSLVSNASIDIASANSLTVTGGKYDSSGDYADANFGSDVTIEGDATLTLNGSHGSSIHGNLNLTGTLQGADTITVTGVITWNDGGSMCSDTSCDYPTGTRPKTIANGGIATPPSLVNARLYLYGRELDNNGAATFQMDHASSLTMDSSAIVKNTATWDFKGNGSFDCITCDSQFVNSGTLSKSFGAQTTVIKVGSFGNTGTVLVSTTNTNGTMEIYNPGTAYNGDPVSAVGTWTVTNSKAYLKFHGGSGATPAAIGGPFSGNGTVEFLDGVTNIVNSGASFTTPVTIDGNTTVAFITGTAGSVSLPAVTLANHYATLSGTDTLTIKSLAWSGDAYICTVLDSNGGCDSKAPPANAMLRIVIPAGGAVTAISDGSQSLWGVNLTNAGTVTCSYPGRTFNLGYGTTVTNGATFTNGNTINAAGAWVLAEDCGVDYDDLGATFTNTSLGIVEKTKGSGSSSLFNAPKVVNTGSVKVDDNTGTLAVHNATNTTAAGTWTVGASSVLAFYSDNAVTFGGAFSGATSSVLQFQQGSYNFTLPASFDLPVEIEGNGIVNFVTGSPVPVKQTLKLFGSGRLTGTDTITVTGMFTWYSSGYICAAAPNEWCQAGTAMGTLNTNGGITATSNGGLDVELIGFNLNNSGVATFNGSANTRLTLDQGATVTNSGTWNLNGDSEIYGATDGGTFNNSGTFGKVGGTQGAVVDGTLTFANTGTINAASGRLDFKNGYTQTGTTSNTFLNGGTLQGDVPIAIQGGAVTGNGTITGKVVNTGAALSPGPSSTSNTTGAITITSGYSQDTNAQFNVKIGGTAAGTFDSLATGTHTATIAGTLNVSLVTGFTPAINNSWTIVTASAVVGQFNSVNFPPAPSGGMWTITYNATTVVLNVVAAQGPAVSLGAPSLSFPNTLVNQSSGVKFVTLTNSGTSALTIASIAPQGLDAAHYKYQADTAKACPISPNTLAAKDYCNVDVVFTPQKSGTLNNAQMVITDNSGGVAGTTQSIALSGTGITLTSIAITAGSSSIAANATEQFTATGTYNDNSTADITSLVTWASSNHNAATISTDGLATGVAAGQTNITAGLNSITSNTYQLTVTGGSGQSTISVSSGSGQSAAINAAFANPLIALVKDGSGAAISGATVTFTAPASGASGTFGNGLATYSTSTNASGLASATFTANGTAGSYPVTAAASGVTGTASFSLTNTSLAPVLSVAKSHSGSFTQSQQGATYSIVVSNAAGAGATSGTVTVTDTLPTGLSIATISGGATWTCTIQPVACTTTTVLAANSSYPTITVTVNVAATATSPLVNVASVSGGGFTGTATANDSTAILAAAPVLTIAKSHVGNFSQTQQGALYSIVVSNAAGAGATSGTVTVTDTLPTGLSIATISGGTTWTCTIQPVACSTTSVLPGGSSYTPITVAVNVAANAASALVNTASVSGGGFSGAATANNSTVILPQTANTLTVPSATGATAGGTFSFPVTLNLTGGVSIDALTFAVQITPVGAAPAFTSPLTFTPDSSITDVPLIGTAGTNNIISAAWSAFTNTGNLSGARVVGVVSGTVPATAALGQTYTVTITGVWAANGGGMNLVPVVPGPNGTLTVSSTYLVGDVYPFTGDMTPAFGDTAVNDASKRITVQDVVQVLFAVNNVPTFVPRACSDRFDAMDSYPVDTGTARGGDGSLDIRDLIREMFRASLLDATRPTRASRGSCSGSSQSMAQTAQALRPARPPSSETEGALELGMAESVNPSHSRIPVYLVSRRGFTEVAVTFAVGADQSTLTFAPAATAPTLAQSTQSGVTAVAWLQGVSLHAGERLLLGYVEGAPAALAGLQVYGLSAARLADNQEVRLDAPNQVDRSR